MENDDEDYGILSDSDAEISDTRSRLDSESSSESREERPVRSKKGALPSTRGKGKKIPASSPRSKTNVESVASPSVEDSSDLESLDEANDHDEPQEVTIETDVVVDRDWRKIETGSTTNEFRFTRANNQGIMNPKLLEATKPLAFFQALCTRGYQNGAFT
ncbi:hypothetical protein RRG08_036408 [Elysia crispata]|uniref:Uncharacterized protein n=1 Tax=Elysia crispata TaxID=231223 RepID=A0AAE1DHK6_9GAST|nr:hypothetical protein RRG08_036408 [Elysia crispata]